MSTVRVMWMVVAVVCVAARAGAQLTELPHVETRGTGDVHVILIHDVNSDWTVWEGFMERNTEKYTMHAVRLPGVGGSEAPAEVLGAHEPWLMNAVAALGWYIGQEAISRPVVIGHGLGGHIALRFGAEYPGKPWIIVTVDGFPAWPLGAEVDPATRRAQVRQLFNPAGRAPDEREWQSRVEATMPMQTHAEDRLDELIETSRETPMQVSRRYTMELLQSDITDSLERLKAQTLVIAAMDTPGAAAMGAARVWERTMGGLRAVEIVHFDRSRHYVMFDEPAAFDRAIAQFVAGEEVRPFEADEAPPEEPEERDEGDDGDDGAGS